MSERVLYLDLVGGASGDMLLAALLDLGLPPRRLEELWAACGLTDLELRLEEAHPAGLRARRVELLVRGRPTDSGALPAARVVPVPVKSLAELGASPPLAHEHRPYRVVRERLQRATLPEKVRARCLECFRRLAMAEGQVHGVDPEEVEFHEVGSDDAIADVVGVVGALDALDVGRVVASHVPLGRGLSQSAHGPIPLPGPATLELLRGVPTLGVDLSGETVTPTAAALLATLVEDFGPAPPMVLERVGVGAGRRSWPDRPNIVRALLGQAPALAPRPVQEDVVLEANLDDMNPEHTAPLLAALFAAGALDVWSHPIGMKKGRTGLLVSALVRRELLEPVSVAFFQHSTTLGVRIHPVERRRLDRQVLVVDTEYGPVRVKLSPRPGGPSLLSPEHDDCERLALARGLPVRVVYEAALRAVWSRDRD